jgi:hypothetical protein
VPLVRALKIVVLPLSGIPIMATFMIISYHILVLSFCQEKLVL